MAVHPTAIVSPGAELGRDVEIGPYCVIGSQVRLGDRVRVGPHVVIEGRTTIGEAGEVHAFAVVGGMPGHLRDRGEGTELVIGKNVTIREHVSLHRGTKLGAGKTRIGDDCAFLANSHVGHDCDVGNGVLLVNGAVLAGHVHVEDFVTFGGLAGVHQFVRIGTMAMIAGAAVPTQDIPPYCMAQGDRARLLGLNEIGLERRGLSGETVQALRRVYRLVFRSGLRREEALARARVDFAGVREAMHFVEFVAASKRGVARHGRGQA